MVAILSRGRWVTASIKVSVVGTLFLIAIDCVIQWTWYILHDCVIKNHGSHIHWHTHTPLQNINDIIWMSWHLKSPAIWQCVQQLISEIEENTKAPYYWPFLRGIYRWISNGGFSSKRACNMEIVFCHSLSMIRNILNAGNQWIGLQYLPPNSWLMQAICLNVTTYFNTQHTRIIIHFYKIRIILHGSINEKEFSTPTLIHILCTNFKSHLHKCHNIL